MGEFGGDQVGDDLGVLQDRNRLTLRACEDFVRFAEFGHRGAEELSGGDFVRNIKQLIDLLRQVTEVAPDAATRATAVEAGEQLFRGVIAASTVVGPVVDEPDVP